MVLGGLLCGVIFYIDILWSFSLLLFFSPLLLLSLPFFPRPLSNIQPSLSLPFYQIAEGPGDYNIPELDASLSNKEHPASLPKSLRIADIRANITKNNLDCGPEHLHCRRGVCSNEKCLCDVGFAGVNCTEGMCFIYLFLLAFILYLSLPLSSFSFYFSFSSPPPPSPTTNSSLTQTPLLSTTPYRTRVRWTWKSLQRNLLL